LLLNLLPRTIPGGRGNQAANERMEALNKRQIAYFVTGSRFL